jgi:hypothetical protein
MESASDQQRMEWLSDTNTFSELQMKLSSRDDSKLISASLAAPLPQGKGFSDLPFPVQNELIRLENLVLEGANSSYSGRIPPFGPSKYLSLRKRLLNVINLPISSSSPVRLENSDSKSSASMLQRPRGESLSASGKPSHLCSHNLNSKPLPSVDLKDKYTTQDEVGNAVASSPLPTRPNSPSDSATKGDIAGQSSSVGKYSKRRTLVVDYDQSLDSFDLSGEDSTLSETYLAAGLIPQSEDDLECSVQTVQDDIIGFSEKPIRHSLLFEPSMLDQTLDPYLSQDTKSMHLESLIFNLSASTRRIMHFVNHRIKNLN